MQTALDGWSSFHASSAMGLFCCSLGHRQRQWPAEGDVSAWGTWDRAQGEGAWAALGRDVHQGEAWQQGIGLLQDGQWGLGLQQKEKAPEPGVRLKGPEP